MPVAQQERSVSNGRFSMRIEISFRIASFYYLVLQICNPRYSTQSLAENQLLVDFQLKRSTLKNTTIFEY